MSLFLFSVQPFNMFTQGQRPVLLGVLIAANNLHFYFQKKLEAANPDIYCLWKHHWITMYNNDNTTVRLWVGPLTRSFSWWLFREWSLLYICAHSFDCVPLNKSFSCKVSYFYNDKCIPSHFEPLWHNMSFGDMTVFITWGNNINIICNLLKPCSEILRLEEFVFTM